jgi:hypothetical protein
MSMFKTRRKALSLLFCLAFSIENGSHRSSSNHLAGWLELYLKDPERDRPKPRIAVIDHPFHHGAPKRFFVLINVMTQLDHVGTSNTYRRARGGSRLWPHRHNVLSRQEGQCGVKGRVDIDDFRDDEISVRFEGISGCILIARRWTS